MHALYICFWVALTFVFCELLFWALYVIYQKMNSVARDHLEQNHRPLESPMNISSVVVTNKPPGQAPLQTSMLSAPGLYQQPQMAGQYSYVEQYSQDQSQQRLLGTTNWEQ